MKWKLSHRFDTKARKIADRHYSRQKPGTEQFVRPGSCLVLWQPSALWVTSWQKPEHTDHDWPNAWECTIFRNEGAGLSSDLIRSAVRATRWKYGDPPSGGMISFVDSDEVGSGKPGYCFECAGWSHVGFTGSGLYVWKLAPNRIPTAEPPEGATQRLFA